MFRGKKLKRVCLILMAAVMLCGCEGKAKDQGEAELLIGFSQLGSESAWRIGSDYL